MELSTSTHQRRTLFQAHDLAVSSFELPCSWRLRSPLRSSRIETGGWPTSRSFPAPKTLVMSSSTSQRCWSSYGVLISGKKRREEKLQDYRYVCNRDLSSKPTRQRCHPAELQVENYVAVSRCLQYSCKSKQKLLRVR